MNKEVIEFTPTNTPSLTFSEEELEILAEQAARELIQREPSTLDPEKLGFTFNDLGYNDAWIKQEDGNPYLYLQGLGQIGLIEPNTTHLSIEETGGKTYVTGTNKDNSRFGIVYNPETQTYETWEQEAQ